MHHQVQYALSADGQPGVAKWHWKDGFILFFASILEKLRLLRATPAQNESLNVKIILADDDEDDREMFEEAVQKIDPSIHIETVPNGTSLFRFLEKVTTLPSLIFLDLNMPGKGGKDCLAEIRKHPEWKNIPVIIYSTSSNKNDITETYTKGANLYLLKPNSFADLTKMIRQAFSTDLDAGRIEQGNFVLKI